MRFILFTTVLSVLASTALSAPVKRGFLGDIENGIKGAAKEVSNLANSNATLSGVAGTLVQSIENPKLTAARLTVVKGLSDAQTALSQVSSQAGATGNANVTSLVSTAQSGLDSAHTAVNNIGEALVSGATPAKSDQAATAVGIKQFLDTVNQMSAAITTPDATLSTNIASAQTAANTLQQGGEGVLSASGVSFADLGLPDNFADS